jgi:hypothetical protein
MPRLLVCRECRTIETLPLYNGPSELEAQDPLLDTVVRRHVQKHGDLNPEGAALLVAPEEPCNCGEKTVVDVKGVVREKSVRVRGSHTFWEGHKDDILKNLGERWTGLHPEFYATKDTFIEDAGYCYNKHRRPQGTDCIDFHTDAKRLTPANWKGQEVYLCDFCPVNTAVMTAKRHQQGLYRRQPGETE